MLRHGTLLVAIGLVTAGAAWRTGGLPALGLAWLGGCFVAVGIAYVANWPGVFGKRPTGRLRLVHQLALLPFVAVTTLVWHLARLTSREPRVHVLTPRVRVGRRLLASEMPAEVTFVVDLTAELPRTHDVQGYLCVPILDGGIARIDLVRRAIANIPASGVTLVHCAQGHGRTAMFAACLLIEQHGHSPQTAIEAIASARPRARMSRAQRAFVEAFAAATLVRASTPSRAP
ncbi:MAG TPA: hypothetical protein VM734_05750 [Kofleriaceae bacterium]|nr:hypothetical protein [Kofleriaceae bacterium]